MLILLDENLPQRLRLLLPAHDVRTTAYQGWSGLTNGALLKTAEEAGFEVIVTADQGIRHQQNWKGSRLAIILLSTNEWRLVELGVEKVARALQEAKTGTLRFVDIGQ